MCPVEPVATLQQPGAVTGFDTTWIFHNEATTPVVIGWVNPRDNIEYSSENAKITPPQMDPRAILQPGHARSLHAFDGHIFHVRPVIDLDAMIVGPIILQHRVGLIPVGSNHQDLDCPVDDVEPLDPFNKLARDPRFMRVPPRENRECNVMDIGFRNRANCPLHGYYVRHTPAPTTCSSSEQDEDASANTNTNTTCSEVFRFHLGLDQHPTDFHWQW